MQKLWNDNRSGSVGQKVGNIVLGEIAKKEGISVKQIVHEKGTTFSTPKSILVGRICSSTEYLQKGVVHFCNLSEAQADEIEQSKKKSHFLFVTIIDKTAHYWYVPAKTISQILQTLTPKPSASSCFLRIHDVDGEYRIGDVNISRYHSTVKLPRTYRQRPEARLVS